MNKKYLKESRINKKYSQKELYLGPILLKKNTELFQKNNIKELEKLNILLKNSLIFFILSPSYLTLIYPYAGISIPL